MFDYDDFDFQEFCEEEREIEQQRQQGQQSRHNYNYRPTSNIILHRRTALMLV